MDVESKLELEKIYLADLGFTSEIENLTLGIIIRRCNELTNQYKTKHTTTTPNLKYNNSLEIIRNYFILNGLPYRTISNMDKAQEIAPNVFLGPAKVASSIDSLTHYKITHVLSIALEYLASFEQFINKNAGLPDIVEIDQYISKEWLDDCYEFISNALIDNRNKVLIHCQYGKTRSGIVAVYYLAKLSKISILKAYENIKQVRDIFIPLEILQMLENFI
jgi:predicted protein tyrosine phosphatase